MRVLHIYSGNLYGGVERVLVTLAQHRDLCPAMRPHFALCFDAQLSTELEATGAPVHRLGNVRVSQPFTVLRARRTLANLLRSEQFDCVICHSAWSQAIFAPVIHEAKVKQVFWLHDAITGSHWLERWARRTPPDLAICNSKFTAGTLPNLYPETNFEVINYPVAPSDENHSQSDCVALRAKLSTADDATVIIQVSRMERWKGHVLHLEALAKIRGVPDWVCWIVGGAQRPHEAAYMEELKHLAARHGITDRVRFLGHRTDVPKLLAAADIHCQPNTGPEPFGITFIEAMYAHLPVVTTAMGGACEIIDETCGALVPPFDFTSLATTLKRLIKSRELRVKLGTAAPARALHLCAPQTQMKRLYQVLASTQERQTAEEN
ncbi:MAG: glycosyltransferase family 4 protein [Pyrinomonadaceae bacterium MAG19_C2-C3]|nr:glycosyltransferase family 4 protein [Pyrinomonadaceae bacterium MAG19_C2-C3]